MATETDITSGVQTVSAAGVITPSTGLDVSAYGSEFTLCLLITSLTAGKNARIQFEASTNAFTNSLPVWVEQIVGLTVPVADVKLSKRRYQLPSSAETEFGVAGAHVRVNVTQLDAGATLSMRAWIEA